MSSPFPGMDPWLESPYIWGDFHQRFATNMSSWLTQRLPRPYYARLDSRPEVGIVEEEEGEKRRIGPDVAVVRRPNGTTAVKSVSSTRPITDSLEVIVSSEGIKHVFVEVRDPSKGHELITLIEIASPSNKRPGKDRKSYLRKQSEVLASNASLVEIDLLRAGKRLFASPDIASMLTQTSKRHDYVVLVNRTWTRSDERMAFQIFTVSVLETLPCIPIPLRQHQQEVPLDLQELFTETYDHGPYLQGAVNYNEPADPPLPYDLDAWAAECLRKAGVLAD